MSNSNPTVLSHKWGSITVLYNGKVSIYRDCKLFPGGSKEWDWKETGTRHNPGIQVADLYDIEKYIDNNTVIILSRGVSKVLNITRGIIDYLKNNNYEYIIEQTDNAINLYKN